MSGLRGIFEAPERRAFTENWIFCMFCFIQRTVWVNQWSSWWVRDFQVVIFCLRDQTQLRSQVFSCVINPFSYLFSFLVSCNSNQTFLKFPLNSSTTLKLLSSLSRTNNPNFSNSVIGLFSALSTNSLFLTPDLISTVTITLIHPSSPISRSWGCPLTISTNQSYMAQRFQKVASTAGSIYQSICLVSCSQQMLSWDGIRSLRVKIGQGWAQQVSWIWQSWNVYQWCLRGVGGFIFEDFLLSICNYLLICYDYFCFCFVGDCILGDGLGGWFISNYM